MRESAKEGFSASIFIVIVLVAILAVAGGWVALGYATLPARQNIETSAQRNSSAYVDSKIELLLKLQADYEKPDATAEQKQAIVNRMKLERNMIESQYVPASTNRFLAGK